MGYLIIYDDEVFVTAVITEHILDQASIGSFHVIDMDNKKQLSVGCADGENIVEWSEIEELY